MPHQKYDRDFREIVMQPFECKISSNLLDETILRNDPFVLTVDPAVADFTCEDHSGKSAKLRILGARSHILEIAKTAILRNKIRVERFKEDPAGNLRSDQVSKPSGPASGSPGDKDAAIQIPTRIA